jgi:cold shock CspA family protein
MPYTTFNSSFTINQTNVSLVQGEKLIFKFILNYTTTSSFTASISPGLLNVYSNATATGYSTLNGGNFIDPDTTDITTPANVIIFRENISSFYGGDYIFVPNPPSGSQNGFYPLYGDVDYPFISEQYDIIVLTLQDLTKIECRVLYTEIRSGKLWVYLDTNLSIGVKDQLYNTTPSSAPIFGHLLWLVRKKDETNAYIIFNKKEGQTSYGFIIPNNLASDVLANIDTITKEVKQKLLADQQGSIQP